MKKLIVGLMSMALFAGVAGAAGNFVHDSGSVAYLNTGAAISSGNLVDLGDRYGVAAADIASNATGTVFVNGVFSLARGDTNAIAAGAAVYYNSATAVDGTATANEYVGLCTEAAAVCTALTNSVGEVNKYVKVDINAPRKDASTLLGVPVTVTKQTGAITATAVITPQTISLTDTNGVTAIVWTNATCAVTIVGGGAVMTNATASNP